MVHFYGNFIGKNCDSGNEGGNDTGYCVWTKWMAMAMTMVIVKKCPVWFGSYKIKIVLLQQFLLYLTNL